MGSQSRRRFHVRGHTRLHQLFLKLVLLDLVGSPFFAVLMGKTAGDPRLGALEPQSEAKEPQS